MAHGHGNRMAEKPRDFKKTWLKLITYSKQYMPLVIVAIVFACIGTVFTIIGPNKISDMTNLIQEGLENEFRAAYGMGESAGIDVDAIVKIAITLGIMYGISAILTYLQGLIMTVVTQKVTYNLRDGVSNKINKLPLKYFDEHSTGDILSRVTNDVDTIGMTLNQSIGNMVSAVVLFLGSLIMMFYTNAIMALAGIVATIIGFFIMSLVVGKSQKYFREQQQALGNINGHVEEIYSGHTVLTAYNGEEKARKEFDELNEQLYNSTWKAQFLSGFMMPMMGFIGNLGYVAVCIIGAFLVINKGMDFGVITAFMIYIRLFTQPLSQFAQIVNNMQSAAAAGERVFAVLEAKEMPDESEITNRLDNIKGSVSFEHVKFGYDKDNIIIKDFSYNVEPGQKIAIVGPTGAGKTTMVNLLMKFYDLNGGDIKIDGVSIKELTRENIHSLFGMVLQDTWMFEGTIRENIVYDKKDVSDEDLKKACKAVGLDKFIRCLPKGYDTVMDDKTALSAGQKQLITIARAMVENAPLLILDEATSSVDTRTEIVIQNAMDTLMKGRTSFVIAHRLSTIKNADCILVLKDGDIIEMGNHEKLLKDGGFYANLYNSQFKETSQPA